MKVNLVKSKCLYDQSYLLVVVPEFITTNSKYDNVSLFNRNLEFIRDLPLPIEDTSIHYSYIKSDQKAILFNPSDVYDALIYFDLTTLKMMVIENKMPESISIFSNYIWDDNLCIISARDYKIQKEFLLIVDTQKYTAKLLPMSECEKVSPLFFSFLQKKQQYRSVVKASLQKKFIVLADYYDEQTLTFINTDTDKSRVVSIKKELDEGKIDKEGYYWPESTPHGIHYQDEWIVLVWEGRVVVISPTSQKHTIDKVDSFIFAFARILSTSEESIKFVISLYDNAGRRPTLAQIYEAHEN